MPFDHVVVVMMENHSFDNVLGALPQSGQPNADGLSFDASGRPRNANPGRGGPVRAFRLSSTAQAPHVSQTWNATHTQVAEKNSRARVRIAAITHARD
jgi:phospholipase C